MTLSGQLISGRKIMCKNHYYKNRIVELVELGWHVDSVDVGHLHLPDDTVEEGPLQSLSELIKDGHLEREAWGMRRRLVKRINYV
jgi:hypothetical protein